MAAKAELRARLNLDTSAFTRGLRNCPCPGALVRERPGRCGCCRCQGWTRCARRRHAGLRRGPYRGSQTCLRPRGRAERSGVTDGHLRRQAPGLAPGVCRYRRGSRCQSGGTINKMPRSSSKPPPMAASSPAALLGKLGLRLGALQDMSPDEQFRAVGEAINRHCRSDGAQLDRDADFRQNGGPAAESFRRLGCAEHGRQRAGQASQAPGRKRGDLRRHQRPAGPGRAEAPGLFRRRRRAPYKNRFCR